MEQASSAVVIPSLYDALCSVPDFRRGQARQYPLASVLCFGVAATLCGYKSYGAMSQWGNNYGPEMAKAVGFKNGRVPCVGTLFNVFSRVDKSALEKALNGWAEAVLAILPGEDAALAGDGKVLRGSLGQGAIETTLLSVVSQRLGLTVLQQAVPSGTSEVGAMPYVLRALVLGRAGSDTGRRTHAKKHGENYSGKRGDYVLIAKGNQAVLQKKIAALLCGASLFEAEYRHAETFEKKHGRREGRHMTVLVACGADLPTYLGFVGAKQVFRLVRRTWRRGNDVPREQVIWGLTSLSAEAATPERLRGLVRGHWRIENRSHWVRDVTFDEDRSQVRVGNVPQVMAALRNVAISLMRLSGCQNIAAACRRFAAQPSEAIALLGIRRNE